MMFCACAFYYNHMTDFEDGCCEHLSMLISPSILLSTLTTLHLSASILSTVTALLLSPSILLSTFFTTLPTTILSPAVWIVPPAGSLLLPNPLNLSSRSWRNSLRMETRLCVCVSVCWVEKGEVIIQVDRPLNLLWRWKDTYTQHCKMHY